MIKDALRQIVPPVLWSAGAKAATGLGMTDRNADKAFPLFEGETDLFTDSVSRARVYGEYGMGTSTRWVAHNTQAHIHAVDTSLEWVEQTRADLDENDRFRLEWIDVGPIGEWGMPADYSKRHAFRAYVGALWGSGMCPDVVLIDGRFRLACWFETMLNARPGTHVIFDDYIERPPFHVVEEYLKPQRRNTRQALFIVTGGLDREALAQERDAFLMFRD